jgi:very-short-patch-repair endonuclease
MLEEAVRQNAAADSSTFCESWGFLTRVLFDPAEEVSTGIRLQSSPLPELHRWLTERTQDIPRMREWMQYRDLEKELGPAGLLPLVDEIAAGQVRIHEVNDAFQTRFYRLWLDNLHARIPAMRQFSTDKHERLGDRFRELDRQAIATAAGRVRHRLLSSPDRPRPLGGEAPGTSELGLLLREVHKKRRHLPLRKLFAALPRVLPRLKPCIMMSPLAVSTYLESPDTLFDLVIFDEASQVRPHDAICAIYRGRQLLVAGDQKQLPPTRFFERSLEDGSDDEEEGLTDYESVLDVCCTLGLPRRRLRWHYRSRREPLIAFANHHLYDNELVTFPSVFDTHENPAITFEYVADGRWKAGSGGGFNAVEARRTAELVLQHFREHPEHSLGVIAFSLRQQMRLLDELERLRREQPEWEEFFRDDRDEPFFVKNLENVQGDERDVIFLSVGYGPDENGKVAMRFGPLNRQGGERRLNVAVTRARARMTVVSSIRAPDLDLSRSRAESVRLLRAYLDYAERGTSVLAGDGTQVQARELESAFEREVFEELTRRGLTVLPQVGCSGFRVDLAVVDPREPGRYLLGVECDGATYHASATARDRDRLRQEVLESLGWRLCRVWSADWIRDREGQVRRVLAAVEKAQRGEETPRPKPPPPARKARPAKAAAVEEEDAPTAEMEFGKIQQVPDAVLADAVVDVLRRCGATERTELTRTVSRQLGFKRTGPRIQERIDESIDGLLHTGRLDWTGDQRLRVVPDVGAARGEGPHLPLP